MGCLVKCLAMFCLPLKLRDDKKKYLINKITKKRKMKLLKIALSILVILAGFINAEAQTADEIINKYIEAMGGKEKISEVKTIYMEGDMDIMNNKAPSVTYIVNGKGYKNDVDFNGAKIITCYTDKGGWTVNPMAGQPVATPVPEELLGSRDCPAGSVAMIWPVARRPLGTSISRSRI